jgi:hypothetical protein
MNQLLAREIEQLLAKQRSPVDLACTAALRVAALTLCHDGDGQITATTVVRRLCDDDPDAVEAFVEGLAAEYDLFADLHIHTRSFAVRFSR